METLHQQSHISFVNAERDVYNNIVQICTRLKSTMEFVLQLQPHVNFHKSDHSEFHTERKCYTYRVFRAKRPLLSDWYSVSEDTLSLGVGSPTDWCIPKVYKSP